MKWEKPVAPVNYCLPLHVRTFPFLLNVMGVLFSSEICKIFAVDACINLGAWVYAAFVIKNEKYFDLVGGITYWACTIAALYGRDGDISPRQAINSILTLTWSGRLSTFLFSRIQQDSVDKRWKGVREFPFKQLKFWAVQSIWCLITALPVYALLSSSDKDNQQYTYTDYATWLLWTVGFLCEVIADRQKRVFKMNPANKGRFITTGLWSISQHPNYMGEILIWIAMWLNCQQHMNHVDAGVTSLSPILVYFLLTRVSGIPLLDKLAKKSWGKNPTWVKYYHTVPQLFPFMGQRY